MSISTTTRKAGPFTCNGATVAFPFTFKLFSTSEVVVTLTDSAGTLTTLALGTNYTVALNANQDANPGGTVTTVSTYASGYTITLSSNVQAVQNVTLTNLGGFYPDIINDELDRLTILVQQLQEQNGRQITGAVSDTSAMTLPAAAARAGLYMGFDGTGAPVALAGTGTVPVLSQLSFLQSGTGAVARTAQDKMRELVTVKDFGATGNGTTDDRAAIALADATGNVTFPAGAYKVSSNLTISSPVVMMPGATLVIPTGVTVTFAHAFFAAPCQTIFQTTGTGAVTFSKLAGFPAAEWWGAVLNNGAVDSGAALQACINATGKLYFPKGLYYGTTGLVANGTMIRGEGELLSGYSCSSATAHLLDNSGTVSAFATGLDAEGFALARSVTPTTPGSSAADLTQGHGIHLDLVSNPRIRNVYTYNNLVELFHRRCLSVDIDNVRGIRQTGTTTDRWVGYYCQGDPTGMPGGWSSGPSGNPSARIGKLNMVAASGVGLDGSANLSRNYVLEDHLQDLWIEHAEAGGGGHIQYDINPNSHACSDAYIATAISDGFLNKGFYIRNMPIGNNFKIKNYWMAPAVAAASASSPYGAYFDQAHGLEFHGSGDFSNATAITGVYSQSANNQDIIAKLTNCQQNISTSSVSTSRLEAVGLSTVNGTSAGNLVLSIGGSRNTLIAGGYALGTKKWGSGVALDASAANCTVDVTKVDAGAVSLARHSVAGAAVTTQGNVGGHVVINPGAGAML